MSKLILVIGLSKYSLNTGKTPKLSVLQYQASSNEIFYGGRQFAVSAQEMQWYQEPTLPRPWV